MPPPIPGVITGGGVYDGVKFGTPVIAGMIGAGLKDDVPPKEIGAPIGADIAIGGGV